MARFYAIRHNPDRIPAETAYVLGALVGDGCVYPQGRTYRIELAARDREFVDEFARAFARTVKRPEKRRPAAVFPTDRGVWRTAPAARSFGEWYLARRSLVGLRPFALQHPAAFLRGLYDAEGNLSWHQKPGGPIPYVRIFNTERWILDLAVEALDLLGMTGSVKVTRPAGSTVRLPGGADHVCLSDLLVLTPLLARRFVEVVGSSIPRKRG